MESCKNFAARCGVSEQAVRQWQKKAKIKPAITEDRHYDYTGCEYPARRAPGRKVK